MGVLDHRTMTLSAYFSTFRSQTLGGRRLKFGHWLCGLRRLCPLYLKILYFLAGPKLRNQPARSLSSARPSLAAIFRVLILRKNLRIRTPLVTDVDSTTSGCNLAEPFFEPSFLRRDP